MLEWKRSRNLAGLIKNHFFIPLFDRRIELQKCFHIYCVDLSIKKCARSFACGKPLQRRKIKIRDFFMTGTDMAAEVNACVFNTAGNADVGNRRGR